jgi:hypothetical protein
VSGIPFASVVPLFQHCRALGEVVDELQNCQIETALLLERGLHLPADELADCMLEWDYNSPTHSPGRPGAMQERPFCRHRPVQLCLTPSRDPAGSGFFGGQPSRRRPAAHLVAHTGKSLRDRGCFARRSIGWHRAILSSACKQN